MLPEKNKTVLSTAYLAPIQYYTKLLLHNEITIDIYETYAKQSFRNRCIIYGANGLQSLVIPVKKSYGNRTKTKDIKIDYDTDWRKNHFKAIESAYRRSPFYEFYEDMIISFYNRTETYLTDFNMFAQDELIHTIEIDTEVTNSRSYIQPQQTFYDYRETIHPKKRKRVFDSTFYPVEYIQVFSDKYGFQQNLSIIDLLCNEGPNTLNILLKCIKKG